MDEATFYNSLGTVGGGNHFIKYDEQEDGEQAAITLHFGSRSFGVKVCNYWTKVARQVLTKEQKKELTRTFKEGYMLTHSDMTSFHDDLNRFLEEERGEHIDGYLDGVNLRGYLCDMCLAQLYAQYNHLTVQRIIAEMLAKYGIAVSRTIMSTHNFIDLHDHTLRKSAIRAYAGEEILVPFNMRDGVAVCEGLSNAEWLNSCAHGAGRKMSRSAAKENLSMTDFIKSMEKVYSTTVCEGTLDESPMAYKDTVEIKDLIAETCVIKMMMKPMINIKATN